MRRAAIRAFRTARLSPVRKFLSSKGFPASSASNALGLHPLIPSSKQNASLHPLQSSMYFRNFSVALVSALVGSGAWYTYKGTLSESRSLTNTTALDEGLVASVQKNPTSASHLEYTSTIASPAIGSVVEAIAPETSRRTLVVENDQFYTAELLEDEPLTKESEDDGHKVLEMMTPDQATQHLRRNEESYLVGRGEGVVRYDVVQIASNSPIEDDHAEKIIERPQNVTVTPDGSSSSDWMFWGVFDGHSGWTTSAKLRQVLISFVARELNTTYKSALAFPAPESIDAAIKKGFLRLDHEIIHESLDKVFKANSKRAAAELLAPALSGSCALLSFYDSKSKLLRVACTGDSRAVLGRKGASGKWTATALSEDLTGGTPSEMERLRREHPGEEYVTRNGRILGGLEPSRAFGDSSYKWSKEIQDRIKKNFFGKTPSMLLKTPPYVTAEPVVTTTKVEPENGDFVVMATDGLWEMLTNEEVVGLVGQWLESQPKSSASTGGGSWAKNWFSGMDTALPVEKHSKTGLGSGGQRAPVRQVQWSVHGSDERFVVEDKNAATHLVRNALGGRDRDMVCALLTLPSPYARRYRDDLTVEVIFFGEGPTTGAVVQNPEASAPIPGIKAKL